MSKILLNTRTYRNTLFDLYTGDHLYTIYVRLREELFKRFFTKDIVQITTVPVFEKSLLIFGYKDYNNFDWNFEKSASPTGGFKKLGIEVKKLSDGIISVIVDTKLDYKTELITDRYDFVEHTSHSVDVLKTEIIFNIFLHEYISTVDFYFDTEKGVFIDVA